MQTDLNRANERYGRCFCIFHAHAGNLQRNINSLTRVWALTSVSFQRNSWDEDGINEDWHSRDA